MVVLLMATHLAIEAYKWQLLIRHIQAVSFKTALRAVLSGLAIGFNTPNRVGDSFGRAAFLDEGNRLKGVGLSMVGNLSQTLQVFLFGVPALLYLRFSILDTTQGDINVSVFWYNWFVFITTVGIGFLMVLYYRVSWVVQLLERIPIVARHRYLLQEIEDFRWRELTRILLLSAGRTVIYLVQYMLLLQVFDVQVAAWDVAGIVAVMFLVMTLLPSITLAELGFRGKIGLQLFGLLSANSIGIIATMAGVWLINLIIPAIIGSLFVLGLRLFRK
jgi:hypothetical protein